MVTGLLGLLGVLAGLQYVWLGQISEAEKDRLQRRLQTDAQRFVEDYNRELQGAYFNFQSDAELWTKKDWAQFNRRYEFWRGKTAYPNLIAGFYYLENRPGAAPLVYDRERGEFRETVRTDELERWRARAFDGGNAAAGPVDARDFALLMPVYDQSPTFDRILIRKEKKSADSAPLTIPDKKGTLIIRLDPAVIKNQILPDLAQKHFPGGDFNLAVSDEDGAKVFETKEVAKADVSLKLFDLAPDNLVFFANRDLSAMPRKVDVKGVIVNQRVDTISTVRTTTINANAPPSEAGRKTLKIEVDGEKPRTVIESGNLSNAGSWTLDVQHSAGSLDRFINATRNKNLGVGFGILALLAVSVVLVFVSAQRARTLARRQIEFVSSVSHEFRTPLAVICSAGENLADGVTKEEKQVSRYGNLIRSEGRKLSKMVEQILEFAGANAGKKKYDLRPQKIGPILESALAECRPLFDEAQFTVEREIAENLPLVRADAAALGQAVQNLLGNSVKYANGEKWLRLTAADGQGRVRIVVEDRGIGIAAADLKHIFEPFFRAKAVVDEQIHGNGLGLSLVRETVAAHGGKIAAESEPGRGSRFTIELPAVKNGVSEE